MKKLIKKLWGGFENELDKKGVHAVTTVNGKIQYYVTKKKPLDRLKAEDVIKRRVWKHLIPRKTNVEQMSQIKAQIDTNYELHRDGTDMVGTLGGCVKIYTVGKMLLKAHPNLAKKWPNLVETNYVGLTNQHVVANDITKAEANLIRMPYAGKKKLFQSDGIKINAGGDKYDVAFVHATTDAAKTRLRQDFFNRVRGTQPPKVGRSVYKRGRTTGLTRGACTMSSIIANVKYGDKTVRIRHAIGFSGMSRGGDSGSFIVDTETGKPMALLFAGNTKLTLGISAQKIAKKFMIVF